MFTIDASVHINALNSAEANSYESQVLLEQIHQRSLTVFAPTLLLVEVAAAVARVFNDAHLAISFADTLHSLPNHIWIPLSEHTADQAGRLAAEHRLRGADAVYAAVAQHSGSILITLDRQQLERLSPALRVQRPAAVLDELLSNDA